MNTHKLSDEMLLEQIRLRLEENRNALSDLETLNNELKKANSKLIESESLKSNFISNIANEIQNPFASILGLAKNMIDSDTEISEQIKAMIMHIYMEAFYLDFQLKNIFMAARLEAGELLPEICNVDLHSLLFKLADAFKFEARKRNISIDIKLDDSLPVKGYFKTDPEKLRIVLANLLHNAIKYSFSNGKVEIMATKNNNILSISVRDFGEGISDTNKKIIFDRFARIDSGIHNLNRGHGLGLSVNKAIIELLDGKLSFDSRPGYGSVFSVYLPESEGDPVGISSSDNEFLFEDLSNGETF